MKIALINCSPRGKKATSEWILNKLSKKIKNNKVNQYYFNKSQDKTTLTKILKNDVLIFAFPNYYGSIPSNFMETMESIEKLMHSIKKEITVYSIVNCGFYFSSENEIALEVMHNWCLKCGFNWGKGISIGTGGSCVVMDKIPLLNLVLCPIYKKIKSLAKLVQNKQNGSASFDADWYVKAIMTCKLYIFIAERIWCAKAKKNGLCSKDL